MTARLVARLVITSLALAPLPPRRDVPEVRQLVTFKFSPGKSREAVALFRDEALPLYEATAPMLRFRGFREVSQAFWSELDEVITQSKEIILAPLPELAVR